MNRPPILNILLDRVTNRADRLTAEKAHLTVLADTQAATIAAQAAYIRRLEATVAAHEREAAEEHDIAGDLAVMRMAVPDVVRVPGPVVVPLRVVTDGGGAVSALREWAYIGRTTEPLPNWPIVGTVVCAAVDVPDMRVSNAKEIASWIKDGLIVERCTGRVGAQASVHARALAPAGRTMTPAADLALDALRGAARHTDGTPLHLTPADMLASHLSRDPDLVACWIEPKQTDFRFPIHQERRP